MITDFPEKYLSLQKKIPLIPKINTAKILLKSAKASPLGSEGRLFLLESQNKALFKSLREIHFFDFHQTNNGKIIGLSQVVAFLYCGGLMAYLNGFTANKDEVEVHHIDGCVTNNNSANLVYLSKQDHAIVSSCSHTVLFGKVKHCGSTPFNRQGHPVKNPTHFLANIIKETVAAVSHFRSGKKIELCLSKILMGLPSHLWKKCIQYFTPHWMTTERLHAINPDLAYRT